MEIVDVTDKGLFSRVERLVENNESFQIFVPPNYKYYRRLERSLAALKNGRRMYFLDIMFVGKILGHLGLVQSKAVYDWHYMEKDNCIFIDCIPRAA